jgi:hypothetical protein
VKLALAESRSERLRTRLELTAGAIARLLRAVSRGVGAVLRRDLAPRVAAELDVASALGSLRGCYGHVTTEYLRST